MKIKRVPTTNTSPLFKNLNTGDVFTIAGDNGVYMKTIADPHYAGITNAVNLETGELGRVYDEYPVHPIVVDMTVEIPIIEPTDTRERYGYDDTDYDDSWADEGEPPCSECDGCTCEDCYCDGMGCKY